MFQAKMNKLKQGEVRVVMTEVADQVQCSHAEVTTEHNSETIMNRQANTESYKLYLRCDTSAPIPLQWQTNHFGGGAGRGDVLRF